MGTLLIAFGMPAVLGLIQLNKAAKASGKFKAMHISQVM